MEETQRGFLQTQHPGAFQDQQDCQTEAGSPEGQIIKTHTGLWGVCSSVQSGALYWRNQNSLSTDSWCNTGELQDKTQLCTSSSRIRYCSDDQNFLQNFFTEKTDGLRCEWSKLFTSNKKKQFYTEEVWNFSFKNIQQSIKPIFPVILTIKANHLPMCTWNNKKSIRNSSDCHYLNFHLNFEGLFSCQLK